MSSFRFVFRSSRFLASLALNYRSPVCIETRACDENSNPTSAGFVSTTSESLVCFRSLKEVLFYTPPCSNAALGQSRLSTQNKSPEPREARLGRDISNSLRSYQNDEYTHPRGFRQECPRHHAHPCGPSQREDHLLGLRADPHRRSRAPTSARRPSASPPVTCSAVASRRRANSPAVSERRRTR